MQLQIVALLSEARLLEKRLSDEKETLEGKETRTDEDYFRAGQVDEALAQLKTADYAYPQPMLTNQISYLLNMLSNADQAPGREAQDRYHELSASLSTLVLAIGD